MECAHHYYFIGLPVLIYGLQREECLRQLHHMCCCEYDSPKGLERDGSERNLSHVFIHVFVDGYGPDSEEVDCRKDSRVDNIIKCSS